MYKEMIGKKVLVRSYDAGVYYGELVAVNGDQVKVKNVRNIWSWEGATCLSQIANEGIKGGNVSQVVSSMILMRVCQIIPLTEHAEQTLNNIGAWKV